MVSRVHLFQQPSAVVQGIMQKNEKKINLKHRANMANWEKQVGII